MEAKPDHASFEQALLKKLSSGNLKKDELQAISTGLRPFLDEGVLFENWKWRGVPIPDTLVVKGRVRPDQLNLLSRMTLQDFIQEIILRKIGVIAINQIEFEAHIATQQAG